MKVKKWVVREHIEGTPDVDRVYEKVVEDIDVDLTPDGMLCGTLYVSVDPYLQGIALDTPLGLHMGADSIMEVLEAGPLAAHRPGDLVQGFGGWQSHVVGNGRSDALADGHLPHGLPRLPASRSALVRRRAAPGDGARLHGGPGMTAWGTLTMFLTARPGRHARHQRRVGRRGVAGRPVGPDRRGPRGRNDVESAQGGVPDTAGVRRGGPLPAGRRTASVRDALTAAAPGGVDRYFDNLGGAVTDAVFSMLNVGSQVAVCWQWATQVGRDAVGPRLLPYIMFPRTTVRGIFSLEWFTDANWRALHTEVGGRVRRGKLVCDHTLHHGFDSIPTPTGASTTTGRPTWARSWSSCECGRRPGGHASHRGAVPGLCRSAEDEGDPRLSPEPRRQWRRSSRPGHRRT